MYTKNEWKMLVTQEAKKGLHFRAPFLDLPLRMNANMLRARIPASPKQSNNQITKPNL